MRKTVSLLLVMVLLASLFLSSGISAFAADGEEPEASTAPDGETEEQEPVGDPLPQDVGFNYRNVYISRIPDSDSFTVTILHTRLVDKTGMKLQYGIASYNVEHNAAEDIEGTEWEVPDEESRIVFKGINETAIVLTAAPVATPMTPAMYFNAHPTETRGVAFAMPEKNVYNLMAPSDPSDVRRENNVFFVNNTKTTREYVLYDTREAKLLTNWERGDEGQTIIAASTVVPETTLVESRLTPEALPYIVPDIPPVTPGADPAFTETGFDAVTGMATLTITTTPGFAYALASGEDGHILGIDERLPWGIAAQTEEKLYVTADETNFYSTPTEGGTIRFRVPPGGSYYVVTRLPNGVTARPDKPYQTLSVDKNWWHNLYYDTTKGADYWLYTVFPASIYSEYALINPISGFASIYYPVKNNTVQIRSYELSYDVKVIARPIPLPVTPPGQNSPSQETFPPVLDKHMGGFGATIDNKTLKVEDFAPYGDGKTAVEDALRSEAGKTLDPASFTGAVVGLVTVGVKEDVFHMVVLYDGEGKPSAALYYYDGSWRLAVSVEVDEKDYSVYFEDGINGDVLIYNYKLKPD